jgi:hypothetical protein
MVCDASVASADPGACNLVEKASQIAMMGNQDNSHHETMKDS